jgi:hypothetical protein
VLALEVFKGRRCSTCTAKNKEDYGCETDTKPMIFDNEEIRRCPLRPFLENPREYSEWFSLYSFREKNVMAEAGGYFDQPNVYIEIMSEMASALGDSLDPEFKKKIYAIEDKKLEELKNAIPFPIIEKK